MPSLGADMATGTLRKWHVKPGDMVKRGDIIAEVETQKGIIDIEVFESGIIGPLSVHEDEKIPVGALMTTILPVERVIEKVITNHHIKASPLARKMAVELNVDLKSVTGTGPGGAVTKNDLANFLAKTEKITPEVKRTDYPSDMRQAIAAAMSRSQQEIPAYVLRTTADIKPCLDYLSEINSVKPPQERILLIALLIKAIATAVKSFSNLNGWWRDGFVPAKEIHIGIVVSLRTGGIVVPALLNADQLKVQEIMRDLSDLIIRSRTGHLKSSEMVTPGITITNLGDAGVESMTGIIYPPQVALIALGGIKEKPWAVNGMLTVRPSMEISMSADHRATDGIYGSKFLNEISKLLADPKQL